MDSPFKFDIYKDSEFKCFSQNDTISAIDISECTALHRLTNGLKYYSSLNIKLTSDLELFNAICNNIYTDILNDYLHLIHAHSNQLEDISNNLIANHQFSKCDVNKCQLTARHSVDRRKDSKTKSILNDNQDAHSTFYQGIFDSVHFYLFHLFDVAFGFDISFFGTTSMV